MTIDEARLVVAGFMEPKPKGSFDSFISPQCWWKRTMNPALPSWRHVDLTLDRLRLVEKRLMQRTDPPPKGSVNWEDAIDSMLCSVLGETHQWHWHASADEKTLALAAVIRGTEPSAGTKL